ncbi:MAG: nucleotide disphospho-sugar-binding domain-containing protein [Gammaproteobacteria bacterium]
MKKVLFTWELGGNLGHISMLFPLAERLIAQGSKVSLTVPDLADIPEYMPQDIDIFQAPRWSAKIIGLPENSISYAEILAQAGYLSTTGISALLRGWRSLFTALRPDLIVAESSPTALLAARSLEIPAVKLGNGFAIPPKQTPFPPYIRVPGKRSHHLLQLEDRITKSVNAALVSLGCQPVSSLTDIFSASETCLLTFPELDHYPDRGQSEYHGAIFGLGTTQRMEWSGNAKYKVLAYLHADSAMSRPIMQSLEAMSAEAIISCPGLQGLPEIANRYQNIQLANQPVDLTRLLPECDLVISHAGHGLAAQSLMAGVPLLTIPRVIEQWITSCNLQSIGAGEIIDKSFEPDKISSVMEKMLSASEHKLSAQRFAKRYADYSVSSIIDKIDNSIGGL